MPSLSRLATECRKCQYVGTCNHKRMQAEAYMMPLTTDNAQSAAMPVMRETMNINVGGILTSVYKDDIERQIQKELFKDRFSMFGA